MHPTLKTSLIVALILALGGCIGEATVFEDPVTDIGDPEDEDGTRQVAYNLPNGSQVEVCNVSSGLNNRSGPSSKYMVLRVLKRGTRASVQKRSGNWFYLDLANKYGWSYGKYLCLVSNPPPSAPPPSNPPPSNPPPAPSPHAKFDVSRQGIINTAKAYVGYSYWWGGAKFPAPWDNPGSKSKGKCYSASYSGHSGVHGADCSGFAAKVWQVTPAMPFSQNKHPYSTYNFYHGKNYWSHISRSSTKMGDALVYRHSSGGHIVIYEKGDPWGQTWAYEARGCSWGVVHNLRSFSSSYRSRKRNGV
jgi:hypothetical protein